MNTLRGWNIGWNASRSDEDFAAIAATGARIVRHQFLITPSETGYSSVRPDSAWTWQSLIRYAEQCKKRNMTLILCPVLHPHPVDQHEEPMWKDSVKMASFVSLWQTVASALLPNRNVVFDLLNEPMSPLWSFLANELIFVIRNIDPYRKIIFEPDGGGLAPGFRELAPLPFKNIIYSVHVYDPWEYVAQQLYEPSSPPVMYRPGHLAKALEPVRTFQLKNSAKIFVGEFSVIRWAPGREQWLEEAIDLFNRYDWGWAYHSWREWHGWDAEMSSNRSDMSRRSSETAFKILTGADSMRTS